jgi:hypothetical protein
MLVPCAVADRAGLIGGSWADPLLLYDGGNLLRCHFMHITTTIHNYRTGSKRTLLSQYLFTSFCLLNSKQRPPSARDCGYYQNCRMVPEHVGLVLT